MAYPTNYVVTYNYTGFAQALGDGSFAGTQLDTDFADLSQTTTEIIAFLSGITRSDGALANGIVTMDALEPTIAAALGDVPATATIVAYADAAGASATAAAGSTSAGAASATAAAGSATAAAASATASAGSASAALTSETNAAASAVSALASAGAWNNSRLAKTAAYTVLNADKGKTIALGGSAFYALTMGAASGYDASFTIVVRNEDTGRCKNIVLTGGVTFKLWPLQTATIYNQNNVWCFVRPGRWKVPNGVAVTIYTDFTNGLDTGANDGMAAGAGNAFKTVQHALDVLITDFDFDGNASGATYPIIQMAGGTTDTQGVHYSSHGGVPGAQGGRCVTIQGTGATSIISCATATAVGCYFKGVVLTLKDMKVASAAGDGVAAHFGAQIYLDNVFFGACVGAHINSQNHSDIVQLSKIWISGNAAQHVLCSYYGAFSDDGQAREFQQNTTFSNAFVNCTIGGVAGFQGAITLGAYTVTGARYSLYYAGRAFSATGVPGTYFPGSIAGTADAATYAQAA